MQPEFPCHIPLNRSTAMTLECLQDAEDAFDLLYSDGQTEVFGVYDKAGRPVKLVKNKPDESVTIEFDDSPPNPSEWKTSRTYEL